MERNERTDDCYQRPSRNIVVLHNTSAVSWLFALTFFSVGFLFIVAPWGLASNSDQLSIFSKLLLSAMGIASALVAVFILKESLDQVVLDRSQNKIFFSARFNKQISRVIDCHDIADTTIDTKRDSDGDDTYRVLFVLKSGETVPLAKSYISLRKGAEAERERINYLLKNPYGKYSEKDRTTGLPVGGTERTSSSGLRPFLITCALVTVTPFAGWWLATLEKPTLQIRAGTPDHNLSSELHTRAQNKIAATEKILFVAAPEPGHEGMAKIGFILFAIIWTIFSICWVGGAVYGSINNRSIIGWFMVLWGLPFVGVGLGLLSIPYFSYKQELHTIYAITDARALIFSEDGVREIVKFNNKHFGPIKATSCGKNNTRMDLLFYSSLEPDSPGATDGFWNIESGEIAKAILEKKLREKSPKN